MIRTRFKKVLLVAPDVIPDELITHHKDVKHISSLAGIFPAIYETTPDLIVFDYDLVGKDVEKVLRRLMSNKFYSNIKIHCYKQKPGEKTDSLLKALGVDQIIYREELAKAAPKSRSVLTAFNPVIDAAIMKWTASVSN